MFFLVNIDNENARSLMEKMAGVKKEGEMVKCSKGELKSYHSGDFVMIDPTQMAAGMEPGKGYVIYTTPLDNIRDCVKARDFLNDKGIHLEIVRTTNY